jgi:hypothetical protein
MALGRAYPAIREAMEKDLDGTKDFGYRWRGVYRARYR